MFYLAFMGLTALIVIGLITVKTSTTIDRFLLSILLIFMSAASVINFNNDKRKEDIEKKYSGYELIKVKGSMYIIVSDTDTKRLEYTFVERGR